MGKHAGDRDPREREDAETETWCELIMDEQPCDHANVVTLAGQLVCNSGCGKDLGPVDCDHQGATVVICVAWWDNELVTHYSCQRCGSNWAAGSDR